MKRLLHLLAHPALAFWLLLFCAVVLSSGAVVARVDTSGIKLLNDMLFQHWLPRHAARPVLYGWIFAVMLALSLLALNTCACMFGYMTQTLRSRLWRRRLGIIIFHGCFLIFLFGHLLSTFWGSIATLELKEGRPTAVPGAHIQLTATDISRTYEVAQGRPLLARISTGLKVQTTGGETKQVELASFQPVFAYGYSLHIVLQEKVAAVDTVRIVMRRDYGLAVLICGAFLTLIALVLYGLSQRR